MESPEKTLLPPGASESRNSTEGKDVVSRPSIHGARAAVGGVGGRLSSVAVPKVNGGISRPPSVSIRRPPTSPSQSVPALAPSALSKAGKSENGSSALGAALGRSPSHSPVASAPSPVSPKPSLPSSGAVPSVNPPVQSTPKEEPVEADATCAIMTDGDSVVQSTKALTPEELEAAGLPPEPEELSEEPELDMDAPVATLPVGMKIDDRYEIQGVLGVGGFATVYRAHHLTIDRDVALKVMDLKKGVDPSYSQRFFREAKIAAKIHHNNVVSIYDFGHVGETGQPYIAMEMLHGHDLSHELTEAGPLSPKRMFVLFRPVLEALGQGHRLGIVHKDLKPENLYLVDPRGQHELMKILDFGVARINSSEVAKLTSAGQLLGTPRYLAPEYIKQQLVSPAIDVYQMALIISEALTGIPAVSGDPFHAMMLHCSGQLQIAGFLLEGKVGEVFRKAISIDPEQRYPDCDAFGAALDEIAEYFESTVPLKGGAPQLIPEGGHVSSKMTAMPFSNNQNTGETGGGVSSELYQPAAKKSNAPIIVLSVLFVLFAGAFAFYFLYMKKNPEPVEPSVVTEVKVVEKEDPEHEFTFESVPSGAKVMLNGNMVVCEKTPCSQKYKESLFGLPQSVSFSLDGYKTSSATFCFSDENYKGNCKFVHKQTNGKVKVELAKADPTEIEIKIVYAPAGVSVTDRKGKKICEASPCSFYLKQSEVYDDLKFAMSGYSTETKHVDYNDMLNEMKKSGLSTFALNVTLQQQKKRPVVNSNSGNTNTGGVKEPPPAPPPKEKKPAISW